MLLDVGSARGDESVMLGQMTDLQVATMLANQIIGHSKANPALDTDQVIEDVVAWFSIQFQVPKSGAHATMAVFLHKHGDLLAAMIKAAG